jgi:predicted nucleic acid-binding protein
VKADYSAILDACVLLPMPLADTLFRMAETPRLYLPKWTNHIMEEVARNLISNFHKTAEQAEHRLNQLRRAFPEAWIEGYEPLINLMTNDPKDRHVVAAAVASGTKLIVTYNRKDFPLESLEPWGIEQQGPSTFLINLYDLAPGIVARKLIDQAQNLDFPLEDLLRKLRINVPGFVDYFCDEQGIDLVS